MTSAEANTVWARAFADELASAGLQEVIVAPGSRSTPLVMAFAADDRFRMRVHLDERSAAFFALGVGKATGRPAAVVTTSGTAVANLFPAVIEASQSGVPLLVLTADRPHRLRGADANQAIDQVRIFGGYPRESFEMAPPSLEEPALTHLRSIAARAHAATIGSDAGPVHVNFPFDKPLEPKFSSSADLGTAAGRPGGAPRTRIETTWPTLDADGLARLRGVVSGARGVVVAGATERADEAGGAVLRFAEAAGYPVLADPLSGARFADFGAQVVAAYDLFLKDSEIRDALTPDVIVRVGASPTSASLQGWLLHHADVRQIVIDAAGRWKDHGTTASEYLRADPVDTLSRLADGWSTRTVEGGWANLWLRADEAARSAIEVENGGEASGEAHEGEVVAGVLAAMPDNAKLFVSSSMPIRDLDAFGHPQKRRIRVFANRGASGIDGVVSSAFGVASQGGQPTVCVIGDVAFFHDQNGLLWSREPDANVIFVLIDNDGGGIFHMLPISEHEPDFTRFFATPHGIDPQHAAAAHGIAFDEVAPRAVAAATAAALAAGRTTILRVRTDRESSHRRRSEVQAEVARSVREALG